MSSRFLQYGTAAECEVGTDVSLQPSHAKFKTGVAGFFVEPEYSLYWRLAFQHGHRLRAQLGFGAQHGFHRKIGNEDGGERHGNYGVRFTKYELRMK